MPKSKRWQYVGTVPDHDFDWAAAAASRLLVWCLKIWGLLLYLQIKLRAVAVLPEFASGRGVHEAKFTKV
jgi:hypothetical protein